VKRREVITLLGGRGRVAARGARAAVESRPAGLSRTRNANGPGGGQPAPPICAFLEFDAFHRERRIPVRRGPSRHGAELYIRFCFPDAATADAFRNRFGGECLTYAPEKPKPRTSKNLPAKEPPPE
jgi:hypothetical protein